jgi:hypothetical protein
MSLRGAQRSPAFRERRGEVERRGNPEFNSSKHGIATSPRSSGTPQDDNIALVKD